MPRKTSPVVPLTPVSEPPARGCRSKARHAAAREADEAVVLLAGLDSLTVSSQARASPAVYAKLTEEKQAAKVAALDGVVHCPEWLGAVVKPSGDRGGAYAFLIETADWTVKVAGEQHLRWPGLILELRSHALHTHPEGSQGAVRAALNWVREQLLGDCEKEDVLELATFDQVAVSRVDIHVDWQGGWVPSAAVGEERRFIRPRRTLWHPFLEGNTCTGYRFGTGKPVMARLYNKTAECAKRHDESYAELVKACAGECYRPDLDVWRLEFELHREGVTGFKLAPGQDTEDTEADVDAELSAEDLPHVGTLPKLFAHLDAIFGHLSYHWLRLVDPSPTLVRARWPLNPTWALLRTEFTRLSTAPPPAADALEVVRGARYRGRARLLRRMLNGLLAGLESEDVSVASASLRAIQAAVARWEEQMRTRAEREGERLSRRRERLLKQLAQEGSLDRLPDEAIRVQLDYYAQGRGVAEERIERVKHKLQCLLGVFEAYGVTAHQLQPIESVADLLSLHLEALEAEAEEKGGISTLLREHFEKLYRCPAPASL